MAPGSGRDEPDGTRPDPELEHDLFERAYRMGVTSSSAPAATLGGGPAQPPPPSMPVEPLALRGCVLTPQRALSDAYVVVVDGVVEAVKETKPQGIRVVDTDGVILPGLIDLHGHPEFNIFAAWEPPKMFSNRYAWRGSEIYQALIREPQNKLLGALPAGTQLRYAEIRALVGGTTAIQGASGRNRGGEESLVRNVDLQVLGQHKARSMIDLPSGGREAVRLKEILEDVHDGSVTAFYLHLAEGRQDDGRSQREFDRLVEQNALTAATVLIHGSALSAAQLGQVADAGAKLVWSPQSNLRLYGETTRAADALAAGVAVGLGADWLPSGSTSLLAELKVAARVLAAQGAPQQPRKLVQMVTSTAAAIAGLGEQLGSLTAGRRADVLVLERQREDPWESVVAADPSWVEMVLIDGVPSYGRSDWIGELVGADALPHFEPLLAWGKPMLLDASFRVTPSAEIPPRLEALRASLISQYPQVGPINA